MKKRMSAIFATLMLLASSTLTASAAERWSVLITRPNLNAYDDQIQQQAFDRIKERTNGELDITTAPVGSLPIQEADWVRALQVGDLSASMLVGDWHAADFPLMGLLQTPFLFRDELEKRRAIAAAFPILQREAHKLNIHILAVRPFPEIGFWATEPIEDLTHIGGRNIRAQAKLYSDIVEAAGGVPVPVAFAEAYTALQRGLVKGIFTGYGSITGSSLHEVAPYGYSIGLNNQIYVMAVNKDKWEALPDSTREIVMEEVGLSMQIIQAWLPGSMQQDVDEQMAGGLREFNWEPSEAWFDLMEENIVKPTLEAELALSGEAGEEALAAIEAALGRSLR